MKKIVILLLVLVAHLAAAQEELFDKNYVQFVDSLSFQKWQQDLGKWNAADCQPLTSNVEDKRWQYNVYSEVGADGFSDRYTYYFEGGKVYRVVLASVNGDRRKWLNENLKFIEEQVKDGNKYRYYDAVTFKVVMVEVRGKYYYWCEI